MPFPIVTQPTTLGEPAIQRMLLIALEPDPDWDAWEDECDRSASFGIESFIENHATDFFVPE